jgi:ABC-type polysaccharide/polyol phosphate export permease
MKKKINWFDILFCTSFKTLLLLMGIGFIISAMNENCLFRDIKAIMGIVNIFFYVFIQEIHLFNKKDEEVEK